VTAYCVPDHLREMPVESVWRHQRKSRLDGVKQVTRAMEDYSYAVMDAQTANNRVWPGSDKNK